MIQNNEVQLHAPVLIVPESCLEKKCTGLNRAAGEAALRSTRHPEDQYAVICGRAKRFGCSAIVLCTGTYADFGQTVEGSDERFLPNPVVFGEDYVNGTASQRIEKAKADGASEHTLAELSN